MTAFFEKSYKNTRTIKTPDFDKKSGVFITFWSKMKHPKKPVGLAVGLASILAKLNEEKNPTF